MWLATFILLFVSATSACAQWQTEGKRFIFEPDSYQPGVHYHLSSNTDDELLAVKKELKKQAEENLPALTGNDKLFFFVSRLKAGETKIEIIYWGKNVFRFYVVSHTWTPKMVSVLVGKTKQELRNQKHLVVPSKTSA